MEYIAYKKMKRMKEYLIRNKIPYMLYQCNESLTLVSNEGEYTNKESRFPSKELWFIKAVKDYILKNELHKEFNNNFRKKGSREKIKYFHYNRKIKVGQEFTDCFEIDMKQAYFETAYMMKPSLIPQHLYDRAVDPDPPLKPISKRVRLAALGSLARTRRRIQFDGTKQTILKPERQTKTQFLWDTICHRVGKLMYKMSRQAGDDFIFFWVDALFVKGEAVDRVVKMMKDAGYDCSISKVKKITFREKDIVVDGKSKKVKNKQTGKYEIKTERPFPYKTALTDQQILELSKQQE